MTILATDVFQLPPQDKLAKPHRGRAPLVFRSGTSAIRSAAGPDQKGSRRARVDQPGGLQPMGHDCRMGRLH
jgi:hypothetical protein